MSSPCPTDDALHAWLSGQSRQALPELARHVASCRGCQARLSSIDVQDSTGAMGYLVPAHDDQPHLDEDALIALVDGHVPSPAIAAHLSVCSPCVAALDDLRAFAAAGASPRASMPARALRSPRRSWWLAGGAAAAAVLLVALFRADDAIPPSPASAAVSAGRDAAPVDAPFVRTPATVVVTLRDVDGDVSLLDDGRVEGAVPAAMAPRVAGALQTGRLPAPAVLVALRPEAPVLLGDVPPRTKFAARSPVGTAVRRSRPVFRWEGDGRRGYRVRVFDEQFTLLAESPVIRGLSWTPSAPLPTGAVLTWQVASDDAPDQVAPGPTDPEARFRVLTSREERRLEQALGEAGGSIVAQLVVLAEAGVIEDARPRLDALARLNRSSPLVSRWRASLR